jgi:catechol 2,3-dioxygenase-like lactoylglutathione lyase family enzyme
VAEPLPLLGVARVSIRVSDLDRARAFYSGLAGFKEVYDVTNADGSVSSAYFKINDDQFLEIIPGLEASQLRPMTGLAIRTDQLDKLRGMLAALGLNPGEIRTDPDGDTGFVLTNLLGQNVGFLEFVQCGPQSLAARLKGQYLDPRRLSTHLEHVGLITTNFDDAYNFYVQTLGFHETYRRVSNDQSYVVLDHIQMPGPSGDFVELMTQGQTRNPLTRKRGASMAHFALTVPNEKALVAEAHARAPDMHLVRPAYGMDNRWNFNLYDPDGTRMEFMQVVDPAHPTPAVVITPANWPVNRSPAQ